MNIETLKRHAREAAAWHGHDLGRFASHAHPAGATAECRRCGAYVQVIPCPAPNDIDIGGDAVAVGCNHGA